MKFRFIGILFIFATMPIAFIGCDNGDDGDDTKEFDRVTMLTNYADNLIIPAYTDLKTKTDALQLAVANFAATPNLGNLTVAQTAWVIAYTSWQYANSYNFGPAGESGLIKGLVLEIGTWPVSTEKIENAITTGVYNVSDFNRDARGFLAVEYLIFSLTGDNAAIIDGYTNINRQHYLNDITAQLKSNIDVVHGAWTTTYRADFLASDGTSVGSSTSNLYNEFVKSYESIKNYKAGIPSGQRPGQIATEPELVEAYYSGKSNEMLKAHFDAIEDIWYGRSKNGIDGIGFKEYLEAVEGGPALIGSTETQILAILSVINPLDDDTRMSDQLVADPTPIVNVHTELQKGLRFFKGDMSSILGIAITYSSGDGD